METEEGRQWWRGLWETVNEEVDRLPQQDTGDAVTMKSNEAYQLPESNPWTQHCTLTYISLCTTGTKLDSLFLEHVKDPYIHMHTSVSTLSYNDVVMYNSFTVNVWIKECAH